MSEDYKVYGNAEPYEKEGKISRAKNWLSEHAGALGAGIGVSALTGMIGHALGRMAERESEEAEPFDVPQETPSE